MGREVLTTEVLWIHQGWDRAPSSQDGPAMVYWEMLSAVHKLGQEHTVRGGLWGGTALLFDRLSCTNKLLGSPLLPCAASWKASLSMFSMTLVVPSNNAVNFIKTAQYLTSED